MLLHRFSKRCNKSCNPMNLSEGTDAAGLTAFGTDGFTVGSGGATNTNGE